MIAAPFKNIIKNRQIQFLVRLSRLNLFGHAVEGSLAINGSEAADVRASL